MLKNVFLTLTTFIIGAIIIVMFVVSYFFPFLLEYVKWVFFLFLALILTDVVWLFFKKVPFAANRKMSSVLSLSDDNNIDLFIRNMGSTHWTIEIIDEIPFQFQIRNFSITKKIKAFENLRLNYNLKPLERGEYQFGNLNILTMSPIQLAKRRVIIPLEQTTPVYPSIIQMKKNELYLNNRLSQNYGVKKMRKIGVSYEFEQIKEYNIGDDIRHLNWKATGRHSRLMINQYDEEKSPNVYSIIDKSRVMLMPFEGLSLMDYAINTCLSLSNIILKKGDKKGLITFSDKIGAAIKADKKQGQLQQILNSLYNQKERNLESNFELLYFSIKKMVKNRSLLFLYTNFESAYALERAIPILRKINRDHLMVIVFFENTELIKQQENPIEDIKGIYLNTVISQMIYEKKLIQQELSKHGIQSILTKPQDLSINSINKYMELKARGAV